MSYETDFKERVLRLIASQPGLGKVALRDDLIIGAILCSYNEFSFYLFRLAVHPEERNRGIERRLLAAAERSASEVVAAKLLVNADGQAAHWCERLGYYRASGNLFFKLLR